MKKKHKLLSCVIRRYAITNSNLNVYVYIYIYDYIRILYPCVCVCIQHREKECARCTHTVSYLYNPIHISIMYLQRFLRDIQLHPQIMSTDTQEKDCITYFQYACHLSLRHQQCATCAIYMLESATVLQQARFSPAVSAVFPSFQPPFSFAQLGTGPKSSPHRINRKLQGLLQCLLQAGKVILRRQEANFNSRNACIRHFGRSR
jgi:hypothetical protein